ncbi:class I SAM-dependent methyltransferase [Saccharibacter sp. EH611]|nr:MULTISPECIES: class I SAM-dependent methyltransferase [unclassified Saccharibacter]MXV36881.1 class I SAM-dependent methyltransferase [Saccharibacter sp. EH611]MXV58629.1 class I SAM-dependent methyltransferase [Saccharibacter sp. EH70]MXV66135.1 class I SAM-dependent methyltransferase [Saccharibacter sp. EH60]
MPDPVKSPHPFLSRFYSRPEEREEFVRGLFDETAAHYDRINSIFSFGTGRWYRRRMLKRAGLRPGQKMLDVAVGTGLVAREAVAITGAENVIGLDMSPGMLQQCRRLLPIQLVQGDAMALPFADKSMDFLSMGYALRHVADLHKTFSSYHRVLKPGGKVLILEISRAESRLMQKLLFLYLGQVVPFLSGMAASRASRRLMDYYWDTIDHCVPYQDIMTAMKDAGFHDVRCEVSCGIFRAYMGRA